MNSAPVILQAVFLGLLVAAPVGPVAILCIQRTLTYGLCTGLQFGLGVAMADAVFSCVAALGLTVVMSVMVQASAWIALSGGMYLFYLGYKSFKSQKVISYLKDGSSPAIHNNFFTAFFVTVTNPMTILSFVAMFSGIIASTYSQNLFKNGMEFVVGIFLGSLGWWFFLSLVVSLLKKKIKGSWLSIVNTTCSALIMLFGVFLVIKTIIQLIT